MYNVCIYIYIYTNIMALRNTMDGHARPCVARYGMVWYCVPCVMLEDRGGSRIFNEYGVANDDRRCLANLKGRRGA